MGHVCHASTTTNNESCSHMHTRYASQACSGTWSLVTWYRARRDHGQPRIHLPETLCVVPREDDGTYHLISATGETKIVLAQHDVAEFEEAPHVFTSLPDTWQDALESHVRGWRSVQQCGGGKGG